MPRTAHRDHGSRTACDGSLEWANKRAEIRGTIVTGEPLGPVQLQWLVEKANTLECRSGTGVANLYVIVSLGCSNQLALHGVSSALPVTQFRLEPFDFVENAAEALAQVG